MVLAVVLILAAGGVLVMQFGGDLGGTNRPEVGSDAVSAPAVAQPASGAKSPSVTGAPAPAPITPGTVGASAKTSDTTEPTKLKMIGGRVVPPDAPK